MFIAIDNYKNAHGGETSTLCEMLNLVQANVTVVNGNKKCDVVSRIEPKFLFSELIAQNWFFFKEVGSMSAYINVIIVATVTIFAYILTAVLINHVRKKLLLGMMIVKKNLFLKH